MHLVWPSHVCVVVYVERTINPIQFSLASKGCFGCHQCHISWLRSPTLKIPRKSVLVMASNPLEGTHINRFRADIPRALSVAVEQRQIEIIFMGTENGAGFRAGIPRTESGFSKVWSNFKEGISECWSAFYLHFVGNPLYLLNTLSAT